MTGQTPAFAYGRLLAAIQEGLVRFAQQISAGFTSSNQARERVRAQYLEDEARRQRLAEWEATDPAGRVAEMRRRHDAEAAVLRARYRIGGGQ